MFPDDTKPGQRVNTQDKIVHTINTECLHGYNEEYKDESRYSHGSFSTGAIKIRINYQRTKYGVINPIKIVKWLDRSLKGDIYLQLYVLVGSEGTCQISRIWTHNNQGKGNLYSEVEKHGANTEKGLWFCLKNEMHDRETETKVG